jgi:hypothetical protein
MMNWQEIPMFVVNHGNTIELSQVSQKFWAVLWHKKKDKEASRLKPSFGFLHVQVERQTDGRDDRGTTDHSSHRSSSLPIVSRLYCNYLTARTVLLQLSSVPLPQHPPNIFQLP